MNPVLIFTLGNQVALLCWLALIAALAIPTARSAIWRTTGLIVPSIMACGYVALILAGRAEAPDGGFGSLLQVRTLFASDAALAAGWLHYLAFDLFVGTWISRTGLHAGVPRLLILACLPLTFLAGPVGLLAFGILWVGRGMWSGRP